MQVIVREPLALQQEAKSVDGVFEITLGRCVVLLLKQIKIILYLVGLQFGGQAVEVQRYCRHVVRIVLKGFAASTQNGNVALEACQLFTKSCYFTAGTVEKFIFS